MSNSRLVITPLSDDNRYPGFVHAKLTIGEDYTSGGNFWAGYEHGGTAKAADMGTLVPDEGYQSLHVCTLDYDDNGTDEGHIFATRPFIYNGVTYSDGQFDKALAADWDSKIGQTVDVWITPA